MFAFAFFAFAISEKIIISSLFGSKSHFKYLVQIGRELQHRGHSIQYISFSHNVKYVRDNFNFTTQLIKQNIQLPDYYFGNLDKVESEYQLNQILGKWLINDYKENYLQLSSMFKSEKPDVVICDFLAIACSDAAKKLNIPLIVGIQSIDAHCTLSIVTFL